MNKIYKKGGNLIIEIPLKEKRQTFYSMDEGDPEEMDSVVGLIGLDQYGNDDMGFCKLIDMSYKGKDDQWTSLFYHHWEGNAEEFEALCKKLGIGIIHETE